MSSKLLLLGIKEKNKSRTWLMASVCCLAN